MGVNLFLSFSPCKVDLQCDVPAHGVMSGTQVKGTALPPEGQTPDTDRARCWGAAGAGSLEYRAAHSYQTKHGLSKPSSSCAPLCLPKRTENLCLHKNLLTDVYNNFIHNSPNLGAPEVSFSWPTNVVQFRREMSCQDVKRQRGGVLLRGGADGEKLLLQDPSSVTLWQRHSRGESSTTSGHWVLGRREDE